MNRGELLDELGRRLIELKGAEGMWDPEERLDALHIAQLEMARDLRLIRGVATANTVIGQQDHSITGAAPTGFVLTNFLAIVRPGLIYFDLTEDHLLKKRSVEQLYSGAPTWRTDANGTPGFYFPPEGGELFNDLIALYPKPDKAIAAGLRLHHLKRPADMTLDTHQPFNATAGTVVQFPSLLPFHYALVWRAGALLLGDENPALAAQALAFFAFETRKAKGQTFDPDEKEREFVKVRAGYR